MKEMNNKPSLLILAAGMGSRYGGLKQMDPVGPHGEIVLDYSVYDALRAGFGKIVLVIRKEMEALFREAIGARLERQADVAYAFQEIGSVPTAAPRTKPWGTGHAVLAARSELAGSFAMINADDFYGRHSFQILGDYLRSSSPASAHFAMVGFPLRQTLSEHGHVARGICFCDAEDHLLGVEERTRIEKKGEGAVFFDASQRAQEMTGDELASMNLWGFTQVLFPELERQFNEFVAANASNPKAEFYIPSVVDRMIKTGLAQVKCLRTSSAWFGVTYREDKPRVMSSIRELIQRGEYPEALWPS